MLAEDHWAPRRCLREPIPQIQIAAALLSEATDAHLGGDREHAAKLIIAADIPAIRTWVTSLMVRPSAHPHREDHHRVRAVRDARAVIPPASRAPSRMPNTSQKAELLARDGHHCVFCGIPVISAEVRKALMNAYPETVSWGATWADCHAALLCMWLQFDHILPHGRGGDSGLQNLVVTCSGCNFGRMERTLDEMGLIDPRPFSRVKSSWDGLERLMRPA